MKNTGRGGHKNPKQSTLKVVKEGDFFSGFETNCCEGYPNFCFEFSFHILKCLYFLIYFKQVDDVER